MDLAKVSSARITFDLLLEVLALARRAVDEGASGVVVVQGTDTLEETAYVLDLLWDRPEPLVLTGAMRTPTMPGADGPANLAAAVTAAATPACRDLGALVVLDDVVHAARRVSKRHSSATGAFVSAEPGPLGHAPRGRGRRAGSGPAAAGRCRRPRSVAVHVDLLTAVLGDDPRRYRAAASIADGLVVAGLGAGHVTPEVADVLAEAAGPDPGRARDPHRRRFGAPAHLRRTRARRRTCSRAVWSTAATSQPLQARLLLTLLLAGGCPRADLAAAVAAHASA